MELFELTELQKVMQDYADRIREVYRDNLARSDRYTTERGLIDSVKTQVVVDGNAFEVTMTLNDYWKYVENDTRPHFPPPSAILRWVEIKPVIPRPYNGKIPTPKQLAFLIGRKISLVGTQGSHDLERAKVSVMDEFKDKIQEALANDVGFYIRKITKR